MLIYWAANELQNQGIGSRAQGIQDTIAELGGTSTVLHTTLDIWQHRRRGSYIMALGVGANKQLTDARVGAQFQCGDDRDHGKINFLGQSVFSQGAATAIQMLDYTVRGRGPGEADQMVSSESIDLAFSRVPGASADHTHRERIKPAAAVAAIVHGSAQSHFWNVWQAAARAVIETSEGDDQGNSSMLDWRPVAYNGTYHAELIRELCPVVDAILVTIPYPSMSREYANVHAAINDCLDIPLPPPIFSVNTDTYHNPRLHGYVGPHNYQMGVQCALVVLTDDNPRMVAMAQRAEFNENVGNYAELRSGSRTVVLFQRQGELLNQGIRSRAEGINQTLLRYSLPPAILAHTARDVLSYTNPLLIALGVSANAELRHAGVYGSLQCGDNMEAGAIDPSVKYFGQNVKAQATLAASKALSVAKGHNWEAMRGNTGTFTGTAARSRVVPSPPSPPQPPTPPNPPLAPGTSIESRFRWWQQAMVPVVGGEIQLDVQAYKRRLADLMATNADHLRVDIRISEQEAAMPMQSSALAKISQYFNVSVVGAGLVEAGTCTRFQSEWPSDNVCTLPEHVTVNMLPGSTALTSTSIMDAWNVGVAPCLDSSTQVPVSTLTGQPCALSPPTTLSPAIALSVLLSWLTNSVPVHCPFVRRFLPLQNLRRLLSFWPHNPPSDTTGCNWHHPIRTHRATLRLLATRRLKHHTVDQARHLTQRPTSLRRIFYEADHGRCYDDCQGIQLKQPSSAGALCAARPHRDAKLLRAATVLRCKTAAAALY